jgi:hypothetical protein
MQIGKICLNMITKFETPAALATSTYASDFVDKAWDRTKRAYHGHQVIRSAKMALNKSLPSVEAIKSASKSGGNDKKHL